MDTLKFFAEYPGLESMVAALARHMLRDGLTPEDVIAAHDEWLAGRMAEMVPAAPSGATRHLPLRGRLDKAPSQRGLPAKRAGGARHRAGDFAQLPHACPSCRSTVELHQLCRISSPVWRTQLACMADGCAWHGKSRLPIDALIVAGAANIIKHITEG